MLINPSLVEIDGIGDANESSILGVEAQLPESRKRVYHSGSDVDHHDPDPSSKKGGEFCSHMCCFIYILILLISIKQVEIL